MILKGYFFSILYGVLCLALGAVLHKIGVEKRNTRKVVHILVGFEWVILYNFMGPSYHFLVVCLIFLSLLLFVYKKRLMPMIASDGDNAPGTVYYAVAMSIMASVTLFVPKMMIPFGIGVFCTSIGDGLAGLAGQSIPSKINPKIYGEKSLTGVVVNLISCFLVSMIFSSHFDIGIGVVGCAAIAVLASELELLTSKGFDNVTITLGASFLAFAFSNFDRIGNYIVPILLTPLLVPFVKNKRALDSLGIVGALLLDLFISVALGNSGFLILLSFLFLGLVTDKIKKCGDKYEQKEVRGFVQVVSNGGVAAVFAVLFLITENKLFVVGFSASLAEALADTSASGIGVFSKSTFDIFRMKRCDRGLSGGVSVIGTTASLVGAATIALISFALGVVNLREALIVIFAGFLGCAFDSLLGSLLQIKYRCKKCGKITEKISHCDEPTEYYRGLKFVDNNVVNCLGTLFSALVAMLLV